MQTPFLRHAWWCCLLALLQIVPFRYPLHGAENAPGVFPVRGLAIPAPSAQQVDRFVRFIHEELAPRRVNTLILRVDFGFQYKSHPELVDGNALSSAQVKQVVEACRQHAIRIVPQINLLGHQSWHSTLGALLRVYPDFDETPWVKLPESYKWPNADGLYCKSYCPLHPKVHDVVFALVDELCDAFETDAYHAGMDEVFYLGEDKCPRCSGRNKAELFAGEVKRIRDHLAEKGRQLWIWGDRLLDGKATGIGEWEASLNGTHPAIDLIPKDVVICDWHYDRADPTAGYFALKGLSVVSCPWNKASVGEQEVENAYRLRRHSTSAVRHRVLGVVHTVWSSVDAFIKELNTVKSGAKPPGEKSEADCFVRTFAAMQRLPADEKDGANVAPSANPIRVLVWDEQQPEQKQAYGDKFLGETIAAYLAQQPGLQVKSVGLSHPDQGLDNDTLAVTDVIIWWSHARNAAQDDARVQAVVQRVLAGQISLIALHSAHWSKPFVRLMQERAKADALLQVPAERRAQAQWTYVNESPYGKVLDRGARLTPYLEHEGDAWKLVLPQCVFPAYRPDGAPGHLTTLLPKHPIAIGIPAQWDVSKTEMYDEPFHVPAPDEVVFEEKWDKGERFRSGCVWKVGQGRVFYFRPGHESYPVYQESLPLKVMENAVRWLGAPKTGS